jgi:hypothetical protein
MRFSTAKVTRPLLTLTDKLTWYRQSDVLIFPLLDRSGDAPVPPLVRARSLSKGRLRDFRRVRAWGPFLYEGQFLLSGRWRNTTKALSRPFPSEARD